jgi:dTDP-4-dehydrorhamnose reductase
VGSDPVVFVTGADGQVGRALRQHLPDARFLTRADLDVTDVPAVAAVLGEAELVVHCAAMTDVDGCERDPQRAALVNALGSATVAAAARRVIMLSTDYVFDGSQEREYREDDATGPINAYGRTKLDAERAVLAAGPNLVVRTSWVFGDGKNFLRAIVGAERAGRELRVVSDQRGRPTFAGDLAEALAVLAGRDDSGVLNVAGDGEPTTWAELAELAVGHPVEHVTTEEWGAPAPRPLRSVLALDRARSLGVPLRDWRASAMRYVKELP